MRAAVAECNVQLAALFALLDSKDAGRVAQAELFIPGDKVCLKMEELTDPAGLFETKYKTIGAVLVDAPDAVLVQQPAGAAAGGADSGETEDERGGRGMEKRPKA